MTRLIILSIFFICHLCSCSQIGEFYSTDKDGEEESFRLAASPKLKCNFGANIIQSDFNAILYVKLLDTTFTDFTIKSISIKINNLPDTLSDNTLQCIDNPNKFKFKTLSDVPDLQQKLYTRLPLQFIYKFNKNAIRDKDQIVVDFFICLVENNKEVSFTKSFIMYRHTRYKNWFASV